MSPSDLELLRIELDVLWGDEGPYRRAVQAGVLIGVSGQGCVAVTGGRLPPAVAARLHATVAGAASPSRVVSECRRVLEDALGPVVVEGGPSYLIPPGTTFRAAAVIRRSDDGESLDGLTSAKPSGWPADEWQVLLHGDLGPWAMALEGRRVVSICHTPRPLTARGAEAGVWTDPALRGLGLASAVTAAWAGVLAPTGRRLFYSTSADNVSSQAVAHRLGLRPIGTLWTVASAGR